MDEMYNAGYAYGQPVNPAAQKRLNYFNIARGLFPYLSGPDAKAINIDELLEVAEKIKAYVEGETNA